MKVCGVFFSCARQKEGGAPNETRDERGGAESDKRAVVCFVFGARFALVGVWVVAAAGCFNTGPAGAAMFSFVGGERKWECKEKEDGDGDGDGWKE